AFVALCGVLHGITIHHSGGGGSQVKSAANNGESPPLQVGRSRGPHLRSLVGAGTLLALGGLDLRALLAEDRDEAAHRVLLPASGRHDLGEGGSALAADQGDDLVFLRGARN